MNSFLFCHLVMINMQNMTLLCERMRERQKLSIFMYNIRIHLLFRTMYLFLYSFPRIYVPFLGNIYATILYRHPPKLNESNKMTFQLSNSICL